MSWISNAVLNQANSPALNTNVLANRPAFGFRNRLFINNNGAGGIWLDTGTSWILIANPGVGSVGTLQTVTDNGNATTNSLTAESFIRAGGSSSQFLKADGSTDSSVYITAAGAVTSITGTANQVIASAATGAVTLSLPQSIGVASSPTFGAIAITGAGTIGGNLVVSGTSGLGTKAFIGASSATNEGIYIDKIFNNNTAVFDLRAVLQSSVTSLFWGFATAITSQAASFTLADLKHFHARQSAIGAGSTITNQSGFEVQSSLIGATNNFGFRGNIASGANRWNLFMNGTAANHIQGTTLFGTLVDNGSGQKVQVTGDVGITLGILQAADQYHNWGAVAGASGYGFRDNAGIMEFKNNAGSWGVFAGGGVTNITGTANQVIASAATGAVTLSLPQSIGVASSPTFGALTVTNVFIGNSALFSSTVQATSFIRAGGSSSQFLKADGSTDSSVYITAAGAVTSITGTANQVIASAATGAVTLSLPQSIGVASSPTFANITSTGVITAVNFISNKSNIFNSNSSFFASGNTQVITGTGFANSSEIICSSIYAALGIQTTGANTTNAKTYIGAVVGRTFFNSTGSWDRFCGIGSDILLASTGSVTHAASIYAGRPNQQASEANYTGTITNYYGVYIDDINGSDKAGQITNKWGIYQLGANNINYFDGEIRLGAGQIVSASVLNTVTNKVRLICNGTTYFLLASTSGA